MKRLFKYAASVLLAGLFLSKASAAKPPNAGDIPKQCTEISQQLHYLADAYVHDRCSGDLRIAAAYIESAGFEFRYQKMEQARALIQRGELELQEISMTRTHCLKVSHLAKPILARVIRVASEMDVLDYVNRTKRAA